MMRNRTMLVILLLSCCSVSLESINRRKNKKRKESYRSFIMYSPAFINNGKIPRMYTCDGEDVSPPLRWDNPPEDVKSFALVCSDPEALGGIWTHWVVFNIPPTVRHLPISANIAMIGRYRDGQDVDDNISPPIVGTNSWHDQKWGGPCPPIRERRYVFQLYALDTPSLPLDARASRYELLRAIKGHVIAETRLVGKYQRPISR